MNVERSVDEHSLPVIYKCFRQFTCNKYFHIKYHSDIKLSENMNRNSRYAWTTLNIIKTVNLSLDL